MIIIRRWRIEILISFPFPFYLFFGTAASPRGKKEIMFWLSAARRIKITAVVGLQPID